MKRLGQVIDSWAVFWLTLICGGLYLAVHLWPASYWLEVRSVNAGPAQPWSVVPMAVSRTVKRDFRGEWTVGVKRFGVAGWVSFCSASGATIYSEGAELPTALDLDWWTNGACPVLPEGRYIIDTSWRIRPGIPFLPNKDVTIRSNIFEVKP